MKKNFVSYLSARLVKQKKRWYVVYYQIDPKVGIRKRKRETFDLNRVQDERIRERLAAEIIERLNKVLLPLGYPFLVDYEGNSLLRRSEAYRYFRTMEQVQEYQLFLTNIVEAIKTACKIKCQTDRRSTINYYSSHSNLFIHYLKKRKMDHLQIGEFTSKMAGLYMDYYYIFKSVQCKKHT